MPYDTHNHFNHIPRQPIPGFVAGEDAVFEGFALGLAGKGDFRVGGGVGDGPIAIVLDAILNNIGGGLAAIARRVPSEADPICALLDISQILHLAGWLQGRGAARPPQPINFSWVVTVPRFPHGELRRERRWQAHRRCRRAWR